MTGRRITGFLLVIAGAAGFTAGLKSLVAGFRDVIQIDGGSCASGGPYVIAHLAVRQPGRPRPRPRPECGPHHRAALTG